MVSIVFSYDKQGLKLRGLAINIIFLILPFFTCSLLNLNLVFVDILIFLFLYISFVLTVAIFSSHFCFYCDNFCTNFANHMIGESITLAVQKVGFRVTR